MAPTVETRTFARELKNGLLTATSGSENVKWLSLIHTVVSRSASPKGVAKVKDIEDMGYDFEKVITMSHDLQQTSGLVQQLCECVISRFTVEWMSELTSTKFDQVVVPIFTETLPDESFMALYFAVDGSQKKDFRFHKCVSLLEAMLTRDNLFKMMKKESQVSDTALASSLTPTTEILVNSLSTLPDKMANKLQMENSEKFLPQAFIPLVACSVLDTLQWAHDELACGHSVSLQMVSALIGKLCITGHADHFLNTIVPALCARVRKDFVWNRICERVFAKVPSQSMEAVLVPLLRRIPWYGLVVKFLGEGILQNGALKVLLCTKLLLHRHYPKPKKLLQNIVGYLATHPSTHQLYLEVFANLLSVWGNKTSMQHISGEQHLYISRALMLCTGCLTERDKAGPTGKLLSALMPGVQAHLESSDPQVRLQAMTVAKSLTHALDPTGPQLEFELDLNNPMIEDLLSYLKLPEDPGPSPEEKAATEINQKMSEASKSTLENGVGSLSLSDQNSPENPCSDLDSDDDLVPYDMSNDRKTSEAKPPKYVRECMEGLICSSDNPDRTELCLQHAQVLISKHTHGLDEISAEFAKVLLHLADNHNFDNFHRHRFKALVALTVACPSQVADYLTSQFYERNYSLRHRMDILEVLAAAAQELSKPESNKPTNIPQAKITEMVPSPEPSDWREVVQRRIESNTRRFAKGRTQPEPIPTLSRFSAVAGQFFYPLMVHVDRGEPFLDMIGRDSALLYRLLYTLAIVVSAAANTHAVSKMGRTLLEFTWALRVHPDQLVRQAVLIATSAVFVSVPTHYLMADLHADVSETRDWLEDVIEKDADTECQKLAAQALLLLQEQVKKEMQPSSR